MQLPLFVGKFAENFDPCQLVACFAFRRVFGYTCEIDAKVYHFRTRFVERPCEIIREYVCTAELSTKDLGSAEKFRAPTCAKTSSNK